MVKITEEDVKEGIALMELINSTLGIVYDNLDNLSENKKHKLAFSYLKMLSIDMIGALLTFPSINKQDEANYICKWIKFRHDIDLEIKVKK